MNASVEIAQTPVNSIDPKFSGMANRGHLVREYSMRIYNMHFSSVRVLIAFAATVSLVADLWAQPTPGSPKVLGPGVLKEIPTHLDPRDSHSIPLALPGLQSESYSPHFSPVLSTLFGQTQDIVFYRDVWQYDFAFLGLRQVQVAAATDSPTAAKQNIWYLVYRIRNTGKNLTYEQVTENPEFKHIKFELKKDDPGYKVEGIFVPRFTLEGWVKEENGSYEKVSYRDQILPEVLRQIQLLEDPDVHLHDAVQMMNEPLPVSKGETGGERWGVAIWSGVDPRVDYVSVMVSGLTNAYRLSRAENGEFQFRRKILQLNFWRPGDAVEQDRDDVHYGIPLVDDFKQQIEICKRYDLPGPVIRGYVVSEKANQDILVAEVDAKVSLADLQSQLTPVLDGGKLPPELHQAFLDSGVQLPEALSVVKLIAGQKWQFNADIGGVSQEFLLQVEPQYWEPAGKKIRFIKSLDHLWIYR
jgi:hypothetical protein